ncbi:Programmed cell death protein 2 [Schistosoma japonicum]|nr:Programmed cell death protein 2 [Schistosoma japonicum]
MLAKPTLGFAVVDTSWHLVSHLFADKVGGKLAWLALRYLPSPNQLKCLICSNPMCFLLQIYSPLSGNSDCFHRMLFLFICRNGECHNQPDYAAFCVFRSQLSRQNSYYSFEPPKNEFPNRETLNSMIKADCFPWAGKYSSICPICGCKADKTCSKRKMAFYYSKVHQNLDWKRHKLECGLEYQRTMLLFKKNSFLLHEYRLRSKSERKNFASGNDNPPEKEEESDTEALESKHSNDTEVTDLESIAKKVSKEEARFRMFKEAMKSAPDQVIRFQRDGKPIWLSDNPVEVKNCEVCGAERVFEFQVTPQLLCHLKLDTIGELNPDFGSLYIFTCSNSCELPR